MEKIDHYLWSDQIDKIREEMKAEFNYNNLYAEHEPIEDPEEELAKIKAREIQTHSQQPNWYNFGTEDVKIDPDMAQSILDGVLGNISDDDDGLNDQLVRRTKRERMALAKKRKMEIPDFEIEEIMGEFDVDDKGNYVILRNDETNELEDKHGRRVNRRGYLIDENGNIINKKGNLIFKENELDSDDEIPPPYSFEKRKKQLLNTKPDDLEDYNIEDIAPEDDDHIWIDPKGKDLPETMSGDETPIESMMGETPGRYLKDNGKTIYEDNIDVDVDSQKETVKLDSKDRIMSGKSSNRTKRMISARVKGAKFKGDTMATTNDGFVRDVPFYFNQMPLYPRPNSKRNTPRGHRGRFKRRKNKMKKHPGDSSLKKIYGNIDPFLYKDESLDKDARLDKVTNIQNKTTGNLMKLAVSADVDNRLHGTNTDEDLDSNLYHHSRIDKIGGHGNFNS
jgi:hypothetical protein